MRIIRTGSRGEDVRDVQHRLLALGAALDADELEGRFGETTEAAVKAFQQRRGLLVDGRVGRETWAELLEAGYRLGDRTLYLRYRPFRGDDVRALQRRLNALGFDTGREDGILGSGTDNAIRDFQRNVGHAPYGIVGPETVTALERLRPPLEAPSRAVVREAEALRAMDSNLIGARVAIDPGHGHGDPGNLSPSRVSEASITLLLADALSTEFSKRGAVPSLLRGARENPTASARARKANELGADVCISVHLNGDPDPGAEGSTCFYFGTETSHSPAGQRLAELIQDRLTADLGLMDARTHPLAIALLRETRMPAVQVEPGFVTNPKEAELFDDPEFHARAAQAIAEGVARFFGAISATLEERSGSGGASTG
jgi:N-acetylmuramoyl-L-alanine amidase